MTSPALLERLRRELTLRGVPMDYSERLLEELLAHYQDAVSGHLEDGLSEAGATAAALAELGEERDIIRAAMFNLRRQTWVGRHRILCMIVAPILVFPIVLSLAIIPPALLDYWLVKNNRMELAGWAQRVCVFLMQAEFYLLIPLATLWLVARLDRRQISGKRFHQVARAAIFAWSVLLCFAVTVRPAADSQLQLSVGVDFDFRTATISLIPVAWRLTFLAALGAWYLTNKRRGSAVSSAS